MLEHKILPPNIPKNEHYTPKEDPKSTASFKTINKIEEKIDKNIDT